MILDGLIYRFNFEIDIKDKSRVYDKISNKHDYDD